MITYLGLAALLVGLGIVVWLRSWRGPTYPKPLAGPALGGFPSLPESVLKERGWARGLSPQTWSKLLAGSVCPAGHLPLQQERERYYEEMRKC